MAVADRIAGLSDAQRAAVTHTGGPLVVLGGAGSGKTTALVSRFAWLVENGVAPEAILVIAAGSAAADALRTSVEETLGDRPFSELAVHTAPDFAEAPVLDRTSWLTG